MARSVILFVVVVLVHRVLQFAVLEQPFLIFQTRRHRNEPVPDCVPSSLDPSQLALKPGVVKFCEQRDGAGSLDEGDRFLVEDHDGPAGF